MLLRLHTFPVLCTCPDCEAEAAAQQSKLEDRLEAELQQEVENALRQPRAKCPWCSAVLSPNDRDALKWGRRYHRSNN
jgi:ssDNA-binding Zn-finger/Zn-ribbon topoisomerase 1